MVRVAISQNHYIISIKIYGVEGAWVGGEREFNQTLCFCTCFCCFPVVSYFCQFSFLFSGKLSVFEQKTFAKWRFLRRSLKSLIEFLSLVVSCELRLRLNLFMQCHKSLTWINHIQLTTLRQIISSACWLVFLLWQHKLCWFSKLN